MNFYDKTRLQLAIATAPEPIADELKKENPVKLSPRAWKTLDFIEIVRGEPLLPLHILRAKSAGVPESIVEANYTPGIPVFITLPHWAGVNSAALLELETYLAWEYKLDALLYDVHESGTDWGLETFAAVREIREKYHAREDPSFEYNLLKDNLAAVGVRPEVLDTTTQETKW